MPSTAYWPCCSQLSLEIEAGPWGAGGAEGEDVTARVRPWLRCTTCLRLSFPLWPLGA